jgi:membrane-associated phospholipid phosphatase
VFGRKSRHARKGSGRPAGRLLPPPGRHVVIAFVAVCVAITALLGAWLRHRTRADWLDAAVDPRIQASFGGHPLLVRLGGPVAVTVMITALVLACVVGRRYRKAALVAISVPAAAVITERLLKPLIGQTPSGGMNFPSGHATGMFAVAAAVAVLLVGPSGTAAPRALRRLLSFAAFLIAAAVAAGVIGIDVHDFSDTVAGAAVGIGTVLLTALILDLISPAWQHPHDRPSLAVLTQDHDSPRLLTQSAAGPRPEDDHERWQEGA